MMIPRLLMVWHCCVGSMTVAWLLPAQPPLWLSALVWGSCAPSVTRKTKGCVLVAELPSPTVLIRPFSVGVKLRGKVCGRVVDGRGIGGRAVDAAGQRKIRIKVLNEGIEPDPELIGNILAGVSGNEQLGDGIADRVGAQLDAGVRAVSGAG